MRKNKGFTLLAGIFMPLVIVGLLLCFLTGLANITQGQVQEEQQQLEAVLRKSAVACFANEGFYPPDLSYLENNYGVQINRRRFTVHYTAIGQNLMPDITVLPKQ